MAMITTLKSWSATGISVKNQAKVNSSVKQFTLFLKVKLLVINISGRNNFTPQSWGEFYVTHPVLRCDSRLFRANIDVFISKPGGGGKIHVNKINVSSISQAHMFQETIQVFNGGVPIPYTCYIFNYLCWDIFSIKQQRIISCGSHFYCVGRNVG